MVSVFESPTEPHALLSGLWMQIVKFKLRVRLPSRTVAYVGGCHQLQRKFNL